MPPGPSTPPKDDHPDLLADDLLHLYNQRHLSDLPPLGDPSPADRARLEELMELLPDYEFLAFLEKGGMGSVYKARQRRLNRAVAVKIFPSEVAAKSGFAERFAREAETLARLNHQNIVTIHDFGQAGQLFYIVMEYVEGASLAQLIARGAMRPHLALAVVPQVCDALEYAHREKVVHRDIKPSNILLDTEGRVKITDFGIAKLLREDSGGPELTGTTDQLGTTAYMAPGQRTDPNHVDHRADIYSLGVVFYQMLTGEIPSGRFDPPSKRIRVDVKLDQIVLEALETQPERRYQHSGDTEQDRP